MKKRYLSVLLVVAMVLLAGCSGAAGGSIDTSGYPDPPEDERLYTMTIYWPLDIMGGDSPMYLFDREGIVEEGSREDPNAVKADSGFEIFDTPPPGGREFYFRGITPGDVVLTIRNENKGKITYECKYILRVYSDLRLALLDVIDD